MWFNYGLTMTFKQEHRAELQYAKNLLENPGLAAKITNVIGAPLEKGFELLPDKWNEKVGDLTQATLLKSAEVAIFSMKDMPGASASNTWHKLGVAVSGGLGGVLGYAGLAAELPVSTTIMMRSIADIARSEGHSIVEVPTKLSCLEVFAFGGTATSDDGTETGYFAVRSALARSVVEAAEHLARKGLVDKTAPVLIKLISRIADKFGVQITQKVAAQAVPAIGAAGGAIINTIFIDHFQDMARGHFIVKRLEGIYSEQAVKELYHALPLER